MIGTEEREALHRTATAMAARGKGVLAADESTRTITKRFESVGAVSTPDNRRDWRELLFRTEDAMRNAISGVILYDETLRQKAADGTPIPELIASSGAIPGVKVDAGATPLANTEGETITEGLDGLRDRLKDYFELGARFTKWRAVLSIGDGRPSMLAVEANMQALARYAALAQEAGLVPIVEPEILMDGDHGIEACAQASERTLRALFRNLAVHKVFLEGVILKPNMVLPGEGAPKASAEEVAEATLRTLKRTVPSAVPGVAFLSGGQSDEEATAHLDAMVKLGGAPWPLTFSYGRALQQAPLKAWAGRPENVPAAQNAFRHRATMNFKAALGEWSIDLEKAA